MTTRFLLGMLLAASLTGPAFADDQDHAAAAPQPVATLASTPTAPAPVAADDAQSYAAREASDREVAQFEGGRSVLIIGGSTVGVVLVLLLLIILL